MQVETLYHIPRAAKDITRVVWVALGAFILILLLTAWLATEYLAWIFGWPAAFGTPMIGAHVYFPFDVLVWTWRYDTPAIGWPSMQVFQRAHLMLGAGGFLALVVPITIAWRRTRRIEAERNDLHGSAHWATPREIAAAGVLPTESNRGGQLLGAWVDGGDVRYLRHKGQEHVIVFAPTRSGKGVGIVIPTLLSWDQSVLVHDIKGENWALTSGFRERRLGQRTLRFDPTSPDSARFNPLLEIRMDGNLVKDVQNIATMIVDPDGKGLNDHWAKTGFDLMTGVVLFVLLFDWTAVGKDSGERCLATVQAVLSDGGPIREIALQEAKHKPRAEDESEIEGSAAVMLFIRDRALAEAGKLEKASSAEALHRRTGWLVVAEASQSHLNKAPNEASGVLSTALSFLSLYRDPIVAENTRVSDFTLESLMGGNDPDGKPVARPTSLYLVVPPSDKDRLKPLLRLLINQVVRRLTERMEFTPGEQGRSRWPHRLLLLLDEFPSLGRLDIFQEALAFIAGYGLTALLIAQDLSQLAAAYGRDESILSNCHIRIAFAPNRIETAELLSKMAGQGTVSHTQRQYSGNRLAMALMHVNTNEQIVRRPLLTADECMRLPAKDQLIFVAGHAPIHGRKIRYYEDPILVERAKLGAVRSAGRRPAR
jgi:type IV secretion system protein VirD4